MEKIKLGVFGAWRGNSYINLFRNEKDRVDLVAICDKKFENEEADESLAGVALFTDFDTFLTEGKKLGMNAVFLANYFNQHAPFAIRCMEVGMDVVSECTAASTLKECVELVETVERTGRKYLLAENYPFNPAHQLIKQNIEAGTLGRLLYVEGEYNHSGNNDELRHLTPGPYHWRAWMPRTYYVTHAMGPLMYATGAMPKYVSARAAHSDLLYEIRDWRHNYDGCGIMFCEMDNGMIARFTGCTAMASDYSRYRFCGDRASMETGGNVDGVRLYYFHHTKPEELDSVEQHFHPDFSVFGEKGEAASKAGHGGGDYWIAQNAIEYFRGEAEPFFDVYQAVAMSATAILGWRSCLNHGENYKIPDFRCAEERSAVRDDDLTPFPDQEGNGATLPCALPFEE